MEQTLGFETSRTVLAWISQPRVALNLPAPMWSTFKIAHGRERSLIAWLFKDDVSTTEIIFC
jgi:hypothetical protein